MANCSYTQLEAITRTHQPSNYSLVNMSPNLNQIFDKIQRLTRDFLFNKKFTSVAQYCLKTTQRQLDSSLNLAMPIIQVNQHSSGEENLRSQLLDRRMTSSGINRRMSAIVAPPSTQL